MLYGTKVYRAIVVDYTSGMRHDRRVCVKGPDPESAFHGMIPDVDKPGLHMMRAKDDEGYYFWCARTQFKDYFLWEDARPIRKNMKFEDLIDESLV